jgi:hypothetical protein
LQRSHFPAVVQQKAGPHRLSAKNVHKKELLSRARRGYGDCRLSISSVSSGNAWKTQKGPPFGGPKCASTWFNRCR